MTTRNNRHTLPQGFRLHQDNVPLQLGLCHPTFYTRSHIGQQLATLLHVATVDVQDVVASDDITLFIHTQATVSIAVIGKPDVQALFNHELLQALDVGGACIVVDIQSVGLCIDDIGISTQRIKHRLSNIPACTVGAVQTNFDTLEGIDAELIR